jgi:ABC-type polysaccharide/polyol phosphate transport system ATPase subunit
MSDTGGLAIECAGVTKDYRLGELKLPRSLKALRPGHADGGPANEAFHALDDVTFDVPRGAFFGIVGSNGSGKSTLTQVMSGITVPTAGRVRVWGLMLPLLEVGAGFHPDLTGRENIALLGTILGLTREQIHSDTGEIAAFAGIERHLDTPLKRYSSGMQARLSFAAAIGFPADVYVFDEVLAVVDDDFRERCIAHLSDLNALGKTILFMSHDLDLVRTVCTFGMWLEKGRVRAVGDMQHVAREYAQHQAAAAAV